MNKNTDHTYISQRMTVKEIQKATGVSVLTIYRELKKEANPLQGLLSNIN